MILAAYPLGIMGKKKSRTQRILKNEVPIGQDSI